MLFLMVALKILRVNVGVNTIKINTFHTNCSRLLESFTHIKLRITNTQSCIMLWWRLPRLHKFESLMCRILRNSHILSSFTIFLIHELPELSASLQIPNGFVVSFRYNLGQHVIRHRESVVERVRRGERSSDRIEDFSEYNQLHVVHFSVENVAGHADQR